MFVSTVKNIESKERVKRTKKAANSSGDFATFLDGVEETEASAPAPQVATVNSAVFLQDINREDLVRENNYQKANKLLDDMEKYRKSILLGNPTSDLQKLVHDERKKSNDPRLEEILDEIELRAAVEAAKKRN
ncbi:MAG: flagellar assembly protein FliX [Rickettsiales bacterium]